jgi:hypothetical protein
MLKMTDACLQVLRENPDPIIRWKYSRIIADSSLSDSVSLQVRQELSFSPILQKLLCDRGEDGRIPYSVYDKWFGAHWVLSLLADLRYPSGDSSLRTMQEQCYQAWLSKQHEKHILTINGRVRRCASQEGNCIYYSLALGLADDRTADLVDRLEKWQWQDGGWNCDKNPSAEKSSFHETLIPLRGMALYARLSGDPKASLAAERAAEIFLNRHLYIRLRDGTLMDKNFTRLHYPGYWHYDILFGLKVMAEAGFISDSRCKEALDLLESKQLPDGGFPSEDRYYRVDEKKLAGHSHVDWGGTSQRHMNPFVTLDALYVLKQAGRLAE